MNSLRFVLFVWVLANACGRGDGLKLSVANKELLDRPPDGYVAYSQVDSGIAFDRSWYQTLTPKRIVTDGSFEFAESVNVKLQSVDGFSVNFRATALVNASGQDPLEGRKIWQSVAPWDLQKVLAYSSAGKEVSIAVDGYQTASTLSFVQADFEIFGFTSLQSSASPQEPIELFASFHPFTNSQDYSPGSYRNELVEGFWELVQQ